MNSITPMFGRPVRVDREPDLFQQDEQQRFNEHARRAKACRDFASGASANADFGLDASSVDMTATAPYERRARKLGMS